MDTTNYQYYAKGIVPKQSNASASKNKAMKK